MASRLYRLLGRSSKFSPSSFANRSVESTAGSKAGSTVGSTELVHLAHPVDGTSDLSRHFSRHFSSRLTVYLVAVMALLVLTGCGGREAEPTPTPTKTPAGQAQVDQAAAPTATPIPPTPTPEPPTPTPEPPANIAPYTGLAVDDATLARRWPILVCVNNDPVGRSAHKGLSRADLVYEYIVDGFTITRITAIYQSRDVEIVGPVRSARLPNIWMTDMYDGVLACSGGSDEVRYLLKNEVGFPYLDADIDDPSNTRYFSTVGDDYRTRLSVSTEGVRRWLADNGLSKEWSVPGFQFSPEPGPNPEGQATVISIPYPGGNSVEWRYDAGTGVYTRFQGGQQQVDQATGQPIVAQNVAVMFAPHRLTEIVEDSLGTRSVDIQLYDFGDFRIFRDGQVYAGTWRADPENPPRWFGPGEVIVPLKPGQTWIQVVRTTDTITYN